MSSTLALVMIILLALAGVVLMVIELFLIPGFGVAGIGGLLSLAGAVVASYYFLGAMAGHISLASILVLLAIGIYLFYRSRALDKLALKTDIDSKVDLIGGENINIGDTAITVSRLVPMGKVKIGGIEVEAKSDGQFIEEHSEVVVMQVDGNRLIVKKSE